MLMPFHPTNAPEFYSAMMKDFKDEWDALFLEFLQRLDVLDDADVVVTATTQEIFIGQAKIMSGSRTIIDDILLWCSNIPAILLYFECVCKIFQKHRVSFHLDKCNFLKDRVECVGPAKASLLRNGLLLPPAELVFAEYCLLLPCAAGFMFAGVLLHSFSRCPHLVQ